MRTLHVSTLLILLLAGSIGCGLGVNTGLKDGDDPTPTPTQENPTPTPTPGGPLAVTGTSFDVLPVGSSFAVVGQDFVDVTALTIGGVPQTDITVDSSTQITVHELEPTTPVGLQDLRVTTATGSSEPFEVAVTQLSVPSFYPTTAARGVPMHLLLSSFPGFDGGATTTVTLGGVSQSVASASASEVEITVDRNTPLDSQELLITNGNTTVAGVPIVVLDLAINELDASTPGTDTDEFVEITTGVPGISLDGYFLVFFNANLGDESYRTIDLGSTGTTDTNGLFLTGNTAVSPDITFPSNGLQNGADGVGLYYGDPADFPNGTVANATRLIDALVYDSADADPPTLLNALLGSSTAASIDEASGGNADADSISRCDAGLLSVDGSVWSVGTPTPGMPNACP